jgi:hypothetical protein
MIIILNEDFRRPGLGSQFSRMYINRDRAEGNAKIMRDYFNPNATYQGKYFQRQFRMDKSLFLTIA